MLTLGNLSPKAGSTKQRKRVGRGQGSGSGGTASRGHKGARARSGFKSKPGFEGGQMPLQRRLPKRGFSNIFKVEYAIVSLTDLDRFESGAKVDLQTLRQVGLISARDAHVKILANGDITKALTIDVDKVSGAARLKIEAAGGTVVD